MYFIIWRSNKRYHLRIWFSGGLNYYTKFNLSIKTRHFPFISNIYICLKQKIQTLFAYLRHSNFLIDKKRKHTSLNRYKYIIEYGFTFQIYIWMQTKKIIIIIPPLLALFSVLKLGVLNFNVRERDKEISHYKNITALN